MNDKAARPPAPTGPSPSALGPAGAKRGRVRMPLALLPLALLAACSSGTTTVGSSTTPSAPPVASSSTGTPASTADPSAASAARRAVGPYEQLIVRDKPRAYWPMRTVDLTNGRTLAVELIAGKDAISSGGPVLSAPGPALLGQTASAVAFRGLGRMVTPLTGASAPTGYTVELWFRSDGCTREWGRIAGERGKGTRVRDGMEVFHYPQQGDNPCSVGVEYWLDGRYLGGCSLPDRPVQGRWVHFAYTRTATQITCYENGTRVDSEPLRSAPLSTTVPFGIGGDASGAAAALAAGTLAHVAIYDRPLPRTALVTHARAYGGRADR